MTWEPPYAAPEGGFWALSRRGWELWWPNPAVPQRRRVMACQCAEPQPHTRPSGLVICRECGGRIEPPKTKRERP